MLELVDRLDLKSNIARCMGSSPIDYTRGSKVQEGRTCSSVRCHNKGEYIMIEAIEIFLPIGIIMMCVYAIGYMSGSDAAKEIYNPIVRKDDLK